MGQKVRLAALAPKRSIVRILAGAGLFLAACTMQIAHAGDPPTSYQLARQARDAITQGDYATARRITASVLANSKLRRWRFYPFEDYMGAVGDLHSPIFGTHMADWVAQHPSDPIALLMSAQYKFSRGWYIRGTGWSAQTDAHQRLSFSDYLTDALGDVEQSIEHDNKDPYAFYLKLLILHGFGLHKDVLPEFDTAIKRFPTYFGLYATVLAMLEPRWGGSIDAMYVFVDQYAGGAPDGSPLKLLYLKLYDMLVGNAAMGCANAHGDRDLQGRCMRQIMQRLVRPELEANLKTAFSPFARGDRTEFDAVAGPILSEIAGTDDSGVVSGELLAMAGAAMHSDTNPEARNPGSNDYAVDNALSNYWHTMGSMDRPVKKAKEALLDIANTKFPSAAEKNEALAPVYEQLARLNGELGRRADAIDAEKSAVDLGVRIYQPELLCANIYALDDYPRAIEVCSQLIAAHPANMELHFWRGEAYSFARRPNEAEADLKVVAESSSPRRVDAAMCIVMIQLKDRNFSDAVATLNRFTYLFDPQLTSDRDVATTYFDRCYAKWQLGDLVHALADCDQSIRFRSTAGAQSIISAIQRQQAAK